MRNDKPFCPASILIAVCTGMTAISSLTVATVLLSSANRSDTIGRKIQLPRHSRFYQHFKRFSPFFPMHPLLSRLPTAKSELYIYSFLLLNNFIIPLSEKMSSDFRQFYKYFNLCMNISYRLTAFLIQKKSQPPIFTGKS